MGQELPPTEEKEHATLARATKAREVGYWKKFDTRSPANKGAPSKEVVDLGWALTWNLAEGRKDVKAHLAAEGNQDPDLKDGLVEAPVA